MILGRADKSYKYTVDDAQICYLGKIKINRSGKAKIDRLRVVGLINEYDDDGTDHELVKIDLSSKNIEIKKTENQTENKKTMISTIKFKHKGKHRSDVEITGKRTRQMIDGQISDDREINISIKQKYKFWGHIFQKKKRRFFLIQCPLSS